MSTNSSGKRLEGFFAGKGFYIVLFLCAAVVGVSAWTMAAGDKTMSDDITVTAAETEAPMTSAAALDTDRVQPVVEEEAPVIIEEGLNDAETVEIPEEAIEVWTQGSTVQLPDPVWAWPVSGELERCFSDSVLSYDMTMRDWRTHSGIDVLAQLGAVVNAAHAGKVESIVRDDLYGTVVTVDHQDGTKAVYANLADIPAVVVGDWVDAGAVIGSVGESALCETGMPTHLHFAVMAEGSYTDPLLYLPE